MADYVKMWENLGMDVKNHDNLCQVLPTAVGDVFMTQENRPKAMDFWDMVIAEVHGIRPAELIEEQKKGRKVFGTFCVYVPDEVIIAANGIVTGLCGGSQFWVPDGEKVLPKNVCPLVKASVGANLDAPAHSSVSQICMSGKLPAMAKRKLTRFSEKTFQCILWTFHR